jgi:hypothetical protein
LPRGVRAAVALASLGRHGQDCDGFSEGIRMSLRVAAPLLGSALLFLTTLPASAVEPQAVADAIGAALTKNGKSEASYESAVLEGGDVVIKGFTLTSGSGSHTVRFEEAIVESPTEDGPGVFQSPRMTFTGGTTSGEPNGSIGSAMATDVTVLDPADVETEGFAQAILYRTAEIDDVRMAPDSAPDAVTVERITLQSDGAVEGPLQEMAGTIEGVSVAPGFLPRGRFNPQKLGYDALVFDIAWDGVLDLDQNAMTVRNSTLSFRNGGSIQITGTVSNLPDPRVLNDADVVAKVSGVELRDLTIRYEDNSLFGRLLDLLAGEQGLSREAYVQQISAALPFLLAALTHPQFRSELIQVLGVFLQNPRSLTLTIEPEPPITAGEIRSMAKSAPGDLPERLRASVTANTPQ